MDTTLEIPECRITSYKITSVPNEITSRCGKYTIKRRDTAILSYSIDMTLSDLKISEADYIDDFYEHHSNYAYFYMTLDEVDYTLRFTSYNSTFSDLYGRKNITFNAVGVKKL
jgi:hypothetical protein